MLSTPPESVSSVLKTYTTDDVIAKTDAASQPYTQLSAMLLTPHAKILED